MYCVANVVVYTFIELTFSTSAAKLFFLTSKGNISQNMTKSAIPNVICFPKMLKNISTIGRLMYPVRKTCERDGTRARVLE